MASKLISSLNCELFEQCKFLTLKIANIEMKCSRGPDYSAKKVSPKAVLFEGDAMRMVECGKRPQMDRMASLQRH